AAQHAVDVEVLRLRRLRHRLVVDGEVVHDVRVPRVLAAVHPLQTVPDDVPDLVGVRRVVVDHRRVGRGQHGGVAVHVLGSLAGQGRFARRGADDEAAGELVAGGPELVAGAL